MARLIPEKLHVKYLQDTTPDTPPSPRFYTLTHSDFTSNLFLSIGPCYDSKQISGLYTRLMRDEVLAELKEDASGLSLKVHCHVSGGWIIRSAKWRYKIFCSELSLALEAIRYGDRALFDRDPKYDQTPVIVEFRSSDKKYSRTEGWGSLGDYKLQNSRASSEHASCGARACPEVATERDRTNMCTRSQWRPCAHILEAVRPWIFQPIRHSHVGHRSGTTQN